MTRARLLATIGDVSHDLCAALTVALVSIAAGMAYAIVAGVDPVYGLYAVSITFLVGSLLAITASNALAPVTAAKIGALGKDTDHAALWSAPGGWLTSGADHVVWRSPAIGAAAEEAVRTGERWVGGPRHYAVRLTWSASGTPPTHPSPVSRRGTWPAYRSHVW